MHRDWFLTLPKFTQGWLLEQPVANQRVVPLLEAATRFSFQGGTLRGVLMDDEALRRWRPAPGIEQEAFEDLTSAELRPFLKEWYASCPGEMNEFAERLRRFLETKVGEPLPLGLGTPALAAVGC